MLFLVEKNKGGLKKMSMFKEKRKLIFSIFLILSIFISMSLVSANNMTDVDSDNIGQNTHNSSVKSFIDLDKKINGDLNKSEILLDDDYVNENGGYPFKPSSTDGIFINRSVIIDGQGHAIDANYSSRIFHINADNVVLKNIVFKNCVSNGGGAVFCNGTNITIINSTFIKNRIFDSDGAAINFKYDGMIINSTFIDNVKYRLLYDGGIACPAFGIINETIMYEINCDDVYAIVSFEKNYNVTIINSTFNSDRPPVCILDEHLLGICNWTDYVLDEPGGIRNLNLTNNVIPSKVVIKKSSVNVFAKNKVFNKKLKTKFYSVVLKCNAGKVLKNTGVTLKIKGKLFKAKTNKKGKATFKITKLNKKGKYNAKISFKGSKYYNSAVKYVKIIIK